MRCNKSQAKRQTKRQTAVFPLIILLILTLLLLGCGQEPLPELPAEEIVQQTAVRTQEAPGFHFVVERNGPPAYVDPGQTLAFRRAEGDYVAPERARATVRIIAPGLVTDVNVISVGAVQWETNLLTGEWRELPPDWGFNPTVLFDSEIGVQAILADDMQNARLAEPEQLEGTGLLYVVEGTLVGDRLRQMSAGLIAQEEVQVRLWVTPETFEPVQILVTERVPEADEPREWLVTFAEFGRVVEIEPPAEAQTLE